MHDKTGIGLGRCKTRLEMSMIFVPRLKFDSGIWKCMAVPIEISYNSPKFFWSTCCLPSKNAASKHPRIGLKRTRVWKKIILKPQDIASKHPTNSDSQISFLYSTDKYPQLTILEYFKTRCIKKSETAIEEKPVDQAQKIPESSGKFNQLG